MVIYGMVIILYLWLLAYVVNILEKTKQQKKKRPTFLLDPVHTIT